MSANNAYSAMFCTEFLMENKCAMNNNCLFKHALMGEVKLAESIPNGLPFVEGNYTNENELLLLKKRVNDAYLEHQQSELICLAIEIGKPCNLGELCIFHHSKEIKIVKDVFPPKWVPKSTIIYQSLASSSSPTQKAKTSKPTLAAALCFHAEKSGICRNQAGKCKFLHGDVCDLCKKMALHPKEPQLRLKHTNSCKEKYFKAMEAIFATEKSKNKSCGVCFEVILQKQVINERKFGILPACNHCFCLSCIRRWRQSRQFDTQIVRACPECRVESDYVCPSNIWVETKEEKENVLTNYKNQLAKIDCKYFKQGKGKCNFGNKCFYRHCLPNGEVVELGPPRLRRRQDRNGTVADFVNHMNVLDDFLSLGQLGDIYEILNSDEDDEDSDYEDLYEDMFDNDFYYGSDSSY